MLHSRSHFLAVLGEEHIPVLRLVVDTSPSRPWSIISIPICMNMLRAWLFVMSGNGFTSIRAVGKRLLSSCLCSSPSVHSTVEHFSSQHIACRRKTKVPLTKSSVFCLLEFFGSVADSPDLIRQICLNPLMLVPSLYSQRSDSGCWALLSVSGA